jgi:uncharacterized membrane protein YccC
LNAVKWISSAVLLATAAFSSHLFPYDVASRFIVAVGAMIVMFEAFRAKNYAVAALFGALALLYNPVAPVFNFSADWQRGVVGASAVPFLASLTWRSTTPERTSRRALAESAALHPVLRERVG